MQNVDNTAVIDAANALPGRLTSIPVSPLHAVHGHSMTYIPEGMDLAFFAMGCFWGPNACSGNSLASIAPQQVTAVVTRLIQPIMKFAVVVQAMRRWFVLFLIPPSSAISSYCRFSGKITIQHKGCVRAVMSGHNTARLFMS